MTSSTVINSITVGTTTALIGEFVSPVKIALQPDTTVIFVALKVTLPSQGFISHDAVRVCFANSGTSYATALDGAVALRYAHRYVELKLFPGVAQRLQLERNSDGELVASGYEYAWLEVPRNTYGLTVSVILNELP